MLAVTTVVAIAVGCAAVFMVSTAVGVVIWLRVRHERLAREFRSSRQGPYGQGLQSYPAADTVTELSREEGSALRQYGQLPFGRPTEWGLLASRESLPPVSAAGSDTSSITDKAWSLRKSLSRSKSKRSSKTPQKPIRLSSLATLTERSEQNSAPRLSLSKDDVPLSAVEGVMELPAETTPRHTPEKEEEYKLTLDTNFRPLSTIWPVSSGRERASLMPVSEGIASVFDHSPTRIRAGSITTQSAGQMPDQPVPPPPVAYNPNRFFMSKNDSAMRLSSMSLATADSSILNEDFRASVSVEGDFTSPALPPCPTFIPFSAYDVGLNNDRNQKSFATSRASLPPSAFSSQASSDARKRDPDNVSPRRSLTARHPGYASERISTPPRRSESLSANPPRRDSRAQGTTSQPYSNPNSHHLSFAGQKASLPPQAAHMQRHSMYEGQQISTTDPFFTGTSSSKSLLGVATKDIAARKTASLFMHESNQVPAQEALPRAPLPSAMKSSNNPRKGHRRQNCVRISIHPPITFGRSVFSPTFEEPEELEELHLRGSVVSDPSTSGAPSCVSSVSPISPQRLSIEPDSHSPVERGRAGLSDSFGANSQSTFYRSESRKRKHARTDMDEPAFGGENDDKSWPEHYTALPSAGISLSRTPSPEKSIPMWSIPDKSDSPYENNSSPRRSMIKGPRSQPGKSAARNSVHRQSRSLGETVTSTATSSPTTSRLPLAPGAHSKEFRKSVGAQRGVSNDAYNQSSEMDDDSEGGNYWYSSNNNAHNDTRYSAPRAVRSPNMQNSNPITIWEDANVSGGMKKRSSLSYGASSELHGDNSPRRTVERHKSTRVSRMHSERVPRHDITTPQRQTVGLGLGIGSAATPASLYDRDGFLKE